MHLKRISFSWLVFAALLYFSPVNFHCPGEDALQPQWLGRHIKVSSSLLIWLLFFTSSTTKVFLKHSDSVEDVSAFLPSNSRAKFYELKEMHRKVLPLGENQGIECRLVCKRTKQDLQQNVGRKSAVSCRYILQHFRNVFGPCWAPACNAAAYAVLISGGYEQNNLR